MANPSPESQGQPPKTVYTFVGKALVVPPEQRVRSKRFGQLDDPVIPRSYWYWTAGLAAAALALGLLLGRFLLG
jgi:hypothetical protein